VCFDAKECHADTFPLQNVHEHQIAFMDDFEKQGGVAFLVIHYTHIDEMYYMPFRVLKEFWDRKEAGGRKSFRFEEMLYGSYQIPVRNHIFVHYLEALAQDLESRE